jgi:hypothetical protein
MSRSYTPLPPSASMACSGTDLLLHLYVHKRQVQTISCGVRRIKKDRTILSSFHLGVRYSTSSGGMVQCIALSLSEKEFPFEKQISLLLISLVPSGARLINCQPSLSCY